MTDPRPQDVPMPVDRYIRLTGTTPAGWIGLELEGSANALSWAAQQVMIATAGAGGSSRRARARASAGLAHAVRCAREQSSAPVRLSYAFQPDPLGPVIAVADASVVPLGGALSLDDAEAELTAERGVLGGTTVSRVDLAWGRTVRVRRTLAVPAGEDTPLATVEQLTHVAVPAALRGLVAVHAQWRNLALGDELSGRVDELVAGLRLTFRQ